MADRWDVKKKEMEFSDRARLLMLTVIVLFTRSDPSLAEQPIQKAEHESAPCTSRTDAESSCSIENYTRNLLRAIETARKDKALELLTVLKNTKIDNQFMERLLALSISRGMPEVVSELLRRGVDPLAADRRGVLQLYNGIQGTLSGESEVKPEVIECVRLVLDKAARIGQLQSSKPLIASFAFYKKDKPNLALLELLMEYGADPLQSGPYSYGIPLETAIATENLEALRILLRAKNPIDRGKLDKWAFDAALNNKAKLLTTLRSGGADIKRFIDANRRIARDVIQSMKNVEVLELLVGNGADPDVLMFSILEHEGANENLEFLLEHGANPNAVRKDGVSTSALTEARFDVDKIRLLLKHGADPNLRVSGEMVLSRVLQDIAIQASHRVELVSILTDYGASLDQIDGWRGAWGALGASRREDKDVIRLLLARGATLRYETDRAKFVPPDIEEKYGNDENHRPGPLTIAIDILERDDLALALIARDKKIDSKDKLALLEAVRRGWSDVTETLLRAGADPNFADTAGATPLAMAERRRDEKLIKLLIASGAKLPVKRIPLYELKTGDEFAKAVAKEIDDVVFLDPPRFALTYADKASFLLYGMPSENRALSFVEIKCEKASAFQIIAYANDAGRISVGVCLREAERLQEAAKLSERNIDMIFEQLSKESSLKASRQELEKAGLTYEGTVESDRSEIYYFPMIIFGHGILMAHTAVAISGSHDRAAIVQIDVMNLCGDGRSMQKQMTLCSNPKKATIEIAKRLLARFR